MVGIDWAMVGVDSAMVGVDSAMVGVDSAMAGVDSAMVGVDCRSLLQLEHVAVHGVHGNAEHCGLALIHSGQYHVQAYCRDGFQPW